MPGAGRIPGMALVGSHEDPDGWARWSRWRTAIGYLTKSVRVLPVGLPVAGPTVPAGAPMVGETNVWPTGFPRAR